MVIPGGDGSALGVVPDRNFRVALEPWQMESIAMKQVIPRTTAAVSVVALALAAGGCGGGGGGGGSDDTMPPDMGGMMVTCDDGTMEATDADCPDPPPTTGDLYGAARIAIRDATTAADAADQAVEDATKYMSLFDTGSVHGDSAMAMANARKVLDAKATADQAVTDAMKALEDARQAKMDAEEHHAGDMTLMDAIDDAIKEAAAQHKAAMEQADMAALADAVAMVTGGAMANPPMTPADHAKAVALDVDMALGPDGTGARVLRHTAAPADTVMGVVRMDDPQGMTWREIVGEDVLQERRIASGGQTIEVMAAPFSGMSVESITNSNDRPADGMPPVDNSGKQYAGNYMNIPGTVFCHGDDCSASAGNLTGSWFFAPTDDEEFYVQNPDETAAETAPYVVETLYTKFGHWLTYDAVADEATVHTYVVNPSATTGLDLGVDANGDDATATYSGPAAGMSVRTTADSDGDGEPDSAQSGAFMATVTLQATFAAQPMLSGTVTGFTGDAVGSGWEATLQSTELNSHGAFDSDGVVSSTGRDGSWTASSYGRPDERPTGINGAFTAHFSDGHAAGAFATRKPGE